MAEKYKIGVYEFETREEWENALEDVKTIESIVDRIDIDDPEHVLAIYKLIRSGRIKFKSELGAVFLCDLSDRVAQYSQKKMTEDGNKKRKKYPKEQSEQSFLFKVLGIGCMVLAIICFLLYGYFEYSERRATRKLEELQNQKNISQAINWYIERIQTKGTQTQETAEGETGAAAPEGTEAAEEIETPPEVLQEYVSLYTQYPDLIGWLHIDDTQIDLPVLKTADNEYYLDKNIDGEEDINGTLFMDYRDDIEKSSTNLIIYGHNMKSGAMFGGLKQYLDANFATGHDKIRFDTIYEKQTYQVIAVCLSKVGYQDDETERYYNFIEAENTEDIQSFLANVRECAVYDRTQDVTDSDKFLTLSTCNSYVEDGRLFVVAKKIQ